MTNPPRKKAISITLPVSLIQYAAHIGRSNVSLGIRHALMEYAKQDPDFTAGSGSAPGSAPPHPITKEQ